MRSCTLSSIRLLIHLITHLLTHSFFYSIVLSFTLALTGQDQLAAKPNVKRQCTASSMFCVQQCLFLAICEDTSPQSVMQQSVQSQMSEGCIHFCFLFLLRMFQCGDMKVWDINAWQTLQELENCNACAVWRAVLCCAVLCCAVLCCAVLCCAVLCCAVLCCAVLCCAVLCCAVLCCAVLRCAVLRCAVLCC